MYSTNEFIAASGCTPGVIEAADEATTRSRHLDQHPRQELVVHQSISHSALSVGGAGWLGSGLDAAAAGSSCVLALSAGNARGLSSDRLLSVLKHLQDGNPSKCRGLSPSSCLNQAATVLWHYYKA